MTLGCVKWVSRTLLCGYQVVLSGFQHVAMWLLRSSGWLFTDPCQKCQLSSLYDILVSKFGSAFLFNASFFWLLLSGDLSLISLKKNKKINRSTCLLNKPHDLRYYSCLEPGSLIHHSLKFSHWDFQFMSKISSV